MYIRNGFNKNKINKWYNYIKLGGSGLIVIVFQNNL